MAKGETVRMRDLAEQGRQEVFNFNPAKIIMQKGFNPRHDGRSPERKLQLQASIKASGVLQPILVKKEGSKVYLVAGEGRWEACQELRRQGWKGTVPVRLVTPQDAADELLIAIRENDGEPLKKWELGAAFARLLESGMAIEEIARSLGHPKRYVTEAMDLAAYPEEVQRLMREESVSPALVRHTMKAHGDAGVETLKQAATKAKETGMPARREKVAVVPKVPEAAKMRTADDQQKEFSLADQIIAKNKEITKAAETSIPLRMDWEISYPPPLVAAARDVIDLVREHLDWPESSLESYSDVLVVEIPMKAVKALMAALPA